MKPTEHVRLHPICVLSHLMRACKHFNTGADPASKFRGRFQWIFASQVSLWVHYCKRDEVHFTTLLWQNNGRQNDLISQMLFSELFKIMVKKVTFIGFRGAIAPIAPPGSCNIKLSLYYWSCW